MAVQAGASAKDGGAGVAVVCRAGPRPGRGPGQGFDEGRR